VVASEAKLGRPAAAEGEVPFLDLEPMHDGLRAEVLEGMSALIDSGAFTNGPQVQAFERAFADYCGAPFCVGTASGLDAIRLAFLAADVGAGDEVIVQALTFVATFEAVSQAGAVPIPVDVSLADYCIDPGAAETAVGDRTRALVPVHLYGQLADMRSLTALARRTGLAVVEDACQAHGARRDGMAAGAAGHAAAFSFYPGKNLGAFGDAGALVTADETLADTVRALREHGQREKYVHDRIGYTARLDTIQALVLLHKLPHLDSWNRERARIAGLYGDALEGIGDLELPPVAPDSSHVWHLFVVRTSQRDELAAQLRSSGIGVGLHYPEPPHLSVAYEHLGRREGEFPIAETLARELLSLPIFPGMREAQVERVVDAVASFFRG
jgi:dTDP-4-amino-4,6-dideoxygalactose transaminase